MVVCAAMKPIMTLGEIIMYHATCMHSNTFRYLLGYPGPQLSQAVM